MYHIRTGTDSGGRSYELDRRFPNPRIYKLINCSSIRNNQSQKTVLFNAQKASQDDRSDETKTCRKCIPSEKPSGTYK